MTNYKTLRVPERAYELAQDAKRDDETWGEYLRRCSENPPIVKEYVEESAVNVEGLDELEGEIVEASDELARLRREFDEFTAELPQQVAREVRK